MNLKLPISLLFVVLFVGAGCAGPLPLEEMTLARAAMNAAKEAGAPRAAPGYWHKAEVNYRKANNFIEDHYNKDAKVQFNQARIFAEKAENAARLKKFKSGEGFP